MKRNITKQLCVCVVVYELLTALRALELALPEEKNPKHVRLTQYQFRAGVYNLLLLLATLLLFIWSMAAIEFELYLWDTFNWKVGFIRYMSCTYVPKSIIECQTFWRNYGSCRLIFLPCICFASRCASTAAKSYILNYMWTAANFIIESGCVPLIYSVQKHGLFNVIA